MSKNFFFLQGGNKGCVVYPNAKTGSSAHCYYPGKWPSSPWHGMELPGTPWNLKSQSKASFTASCKIAAVCLTVCSLSHVFIKWWWQPLLQTIAKGLSGPRLSRSKAGGIPGLPWAGTASSANKLFPTEPPRLEEVAGVISSFYELLWTLWGGGRCPSNKVPVFFLILFLFSN